MVTLYGQDRYTNVNDYNINYFYAGSNTQLVICNKDRTVNLINHSTDTELKKSLQILSGKLRKYLATIGTVSTVIFINMLTVSTYSYSNSNLNLTFQNSDNLTITLHSDYEAVNTYNYIHNIYLSANLEDYIQDKTKHYVHPNYEENLTTRKYATWERALLYATANDVVILEKGTYINLEVLLKDGVDTVMQDCYFQNVNTNDRASIMDSIPLNTNPVDCKIFGNGIFSYRNPNRSYHWLALDIHSNSNVYFEFDAMYSEDAGATSFIHQWRGTIWTKGNLLYSNVTRTYDSESILEGEPITFDNDIAYHIAESGSIMYVPFSGYTTNFYFRNTYFENKGTGDPEYVGGDLLSLQEAYIPNINMIMARFNAKHIYNGVVSSAVMTSYADTETANSSFRIWLSEFYNLNESQYIFVAPTYTELVPIECILNSYGNRVSEVTFEDATPYILDASLTIDRNNFTDIIFSESYFLKYTTDNVLTDYTEAMEQKKYNLLLTTAVTNLLSDLNEYYPNQSVIITDKEGTKYLINIDRVLQIDKDVTTSRIFLEYDNYDLWFESTPADVNGYYTNLLELKSDWETLKNTFHDI